MSTQTATNIENTHIGLVVVVVVVVDIVIHIDDKSEDSKDEANVVEGVGATEDSVHVCTGAEGRWAGQVKTRHRPPTPPLPQSRVHSGVLGEYPVKLLHPRPQSRPHLHLPPGLRFQPSSQRRSVG